MKEIVGMRVEGSNLFFNKPFSSNYEIKGDDVEQRNELRVYRCSPNEMMLQIRTFKPITESFRKGGKPRKMIANVHLTVDEIEAILEYAKECMK